MKRKKVVLMTAIAVTAITILGACGKSTEDTIAQADTEALLTEETEEIEIETETEIPVIDADGRYIDFPEDYVTYTSIEEKTMYGIGTGHMYENPNMTKGELVTGGRVDYGNEFIINATCEIEGTQYYRTAPNDRNQMFIIEQSLLSDTLPSEDQTNNNSYNPEANPDQPVVVDVTDDLPDDFPGGDGNTFSWDNVEVIEGSQADYDDPNLGEILDAADGMTWY